MILKSFLPKELFYLTFDLLISSNYPIIEYVIIVEYTTKGTKTIIQVLEMIYYKLNVPMQLIVVVIK